MKLLKVIVFIILIIPVIVIGASAWLLDMFCYYAAEFFYYSENAIDKEQRTSIFDSYISWARKVSKID